MTGDVRPPAGTRCMPCNKVGHTCLAARYADGEFFPKGMPVCAYCADGESCGKGSSAVAVQTVPAPAAKRKPEPAAEVVLRGPHVPPAAAKERNHFGHAVPVQKMCVRGCGKPRHRGGCMVDRERCGGVMAGRAERREEIKKLLLEGKSASVVAGIVGVTDQTVYNVRRGMPELQGKTPVGVAARVARKVENVTVTTKVLEKAQDSIESAAKLPEKFAAEGYRVITLAEMTGKKRNGAYDELFEAFLKLPKLSVLTREFPNRDIAHTYKLALCRIGRKRGLKMRQQQHGATIHVWQE